MVSVNSLDKYISVYAQYKKSLSETKILEFCVRQLEHSLVEEDLEKLVSVVPKAELERLRRRVESRGMPDLPWNIKEAA